MRRVKLTADQKLDEALKGTFPASDAFYLPPAMTTLESVLVATDFSTEAAAAMRRAESIGGQIGLQGALAHVLPTSLPHAIHVQAASLAQQTLALGVDEMNRAGLRFEQRLLSGDVVGELARAAAGFDLVVAGARGEGMLLDFSLGRTSVRLVRESPQPVLIVKRAPDGPYRRVLVAVDFSAPSRLAAALGVQIAPRADFELAHVFSVDLEPTLRRIGLAEDKLEAYRLEAHENATAAVAQFAGELALPGGRMRSTIVRGYPPRVLVERAAQGGAQLIVMGKRAAGIVERSLVGSVALRVLEMSECDVLIVPDRIA
jgi:nucleotide-binding universal stress UspA family protein